MRIFSQSKDHQPTHENEMGVKCLVRMKKYRSYKGRVGRIVPIFYNVIFSLENESKMGNRRNEINIYLGEKRYLSPILDLCKWWNYCLQSDETPCL